MRDAEPAEFPPQRLERIEPKHPAVWIRVEGTWRSGWIVKWVHDPVSGNWLVWARWKQPRPWSAYGWLVHDEATIRLRDGDEPPQ